MRRVSLNISNSLYELYSNEYIANSYIYTPNINAISYNFYKVPHISMP